jgi:Type II secretory pathway, component PulF
MGNRSVLLFTRLLAELSAQNIPLQAALMAMTTMAGVPEKVREGAAEIECRLEAGTSFALALSQCKSIFFSEVYQSFMYAAQETGNITQSISFLLEREERTARQRTTIVSVCVYPLFVVIAAFVGSILFITFGSKLAPSVVGEFDMASYKEHARSGCVVANVFLLVCVFCGSLLLKKIARGDEKRSVFESLSFLTQAGVDLYHSLEITLTVARKSPKWERILLSVMEELKKGISPVKAFVCFGAESELCISVAEQCGNICGAFKKLAYAAEEKEKRFAKQCMNLAEPVAMMVVAVYLILLLKSSIMPVLFGYGF